MSKEAVEKEQEAQDQAPENTVNEEQVTDENQDQATEESESKEEAPKEKTPEDELAEYKDKFLRLYAEFENFRRRTAKERLEFEKTAIERLVVDILPVIDDFERAQGSMADATDIDAVKEGVNLVHQKLVNTLTQKGLKPIGAQGETFDSELHEAITQIPAPSDDMKGKVVDEVEKGYYLGEKVIRFSKVVIGS